MMENLRPGAPISVSAMQALAAQVARSRPALGGATRMSGVGGTAPVKDGDDWFLVKITDVDGTGSTATYSFVEQMVEGNVGDLMDRGSPRYAHKDRNPGRCVLAGHTLSVDDPAMARRNVGTPGEFELVPIGAGGTEWRAGYVVSRDTGPPIAYTVQPIKLNSSGAWVIDGATVSPCYRMPSSKYDETDLIEIPDPEGAATQGVLWRPDPNEAGKYQMTPWGGVWKVVKKELVFSCTRCVETSPGVFENITTNVFRFLAHFARDFRVTWKPPETAEGPIEADLEETP